MTLKEITGKESGIVYYKGGGICVANWRDYDDNTIPMFFPYTNSMIPWPVNNELKAICRMHYYSFVEAYNFYVDTVPIFVCDDDNLIGALLGKYGQNYHMTPPNFKENGEVEDTPCYVFEISEDIIIFTFENWN